MSTSILLGDVRERLAGLPADHFDIVVTSPPYWGLRDYGTGEWVGGDPECKHRSATMREGRNEERAALAGSVASNSAQLRLAHNGACGLCGAVKVDSQIGLERTLADHLEVMVGVFREVRRVLKPTGFAWVNYGDCYATSPNGRSAADTKAAGGDDRTFRDKPFSTIGAALVGDLDLFDRPFRDVVNAVKAKDLCMVPNLLAVALRADGWWVRSETIWGKSNPMPESVRDRPATAHEKLFLIAKAPRYAYDAAAVRQSLTATSIGRLAQDVDGQAGSSRAHAGRKQNGAMKAVGDRQAAIAAASLGSPPRRMAGFNERWENGTKQRGLTPRHAVENNHVGIEGTPRGEGRNLRNYEPAPVNVWPISTRPFRDAHFATFPPELVERCLMAAPKRCCATCGAPHARVVDRAFAPQEDCSVAAGARQADEHDVSSSWPGTTRGSVAIDTIGFAPACTCDSGWVPATVLDPFGGAGTTALVADRLGLDCTLIELNAEYAEIARKRLVDDALLTAEVTLTPIVAEPVDPTPDLFGGAA